MDANAGRVDRDGSSGGQVAARGTRGAVVMLGLFAATAAGPRPPDATWRAREDAHVHLFSPDVTRLLGKYDPAATPVGVRDAAQALAMLDRTGTARAAVVSAAYLLALPGLDEARQAAAVRGENAWLAAQVASANGRLVGFCSVPVLATYAEAEVRWCARNPNVQGLKLYLTRNGFDLRNSGHAARLGRLFGLADSLGLDLLIHMRTERPDYGAEDVRLFVRDVLPHARRVAVQIAHVAGWGGYDRATDSALGEFAAALEDGRASRENLYFDLAVVVCPGVDEPSDERLRLEAPLDRLEAKVRRIGGDRFLFGSDWPLYETGEYAREVGGLMPGFLQETRGTPRWTTSPRLAAR